LPNVKELSLQSINKENYFSAIYTMLSLPVIILIVLKLFKMDDDTESEPDNKKPKGKKRKHPFRAKRKR